MKTRSKLMLLGLVLLTSAQISFAQDAKFSMAGMPPYVRELQRGMPSSELMQTDPALYKHLMQRYAMLSGMLQKAVADKQLPKEALQVLGMQQPQKMTDRKLAATEAVKKNTSNAYNLVKDINNMASSNPNNYNYSYTSSFAVLNKVLYYAANDGIHGMELWRSDGTAAGTYIVTDLVTGFTASSPQDITVFKNKLYFTAYDPDAGYELYKSDGTAAGTKLLKDILPGANGSYPRHFTVMGNLLYFTTSNANYYPDAQIWRTDGTSGGTVMVADLYSIAYAYNIGQLTAVNNSLFFTVFAYSYGRELWKTDGANTYLVKDINLYNNNTYSDINGPANLTSFNNLLYFSADNGYGRTLWQSDGTFGGTNIVANQNGVTVSGSQFAGYQDQPFAIAKNALFFAGSYYTTGTELYKFNPSNSDGIVLVKDISTADASSVLSTENIVSMKDSIYCIVPDFTGKVFNLWKSGGSAANTKIVKTLNGVSSYSVLYSIGSKIYFSAYSETAGREPWVSDGTASGTKMIKDLYPGALSSAPGYYTSYNGKVYFSAYTNNKGNELCVTNGSAAGTKIVLDANTTCTEDGVSGSEDHQAVTLNANNILFAGNQFSTGSELWKSNGTGSGTAMVSDLYPGYNSGYPQFYDVKNGKAYFSAYDSSGNACICVTDGSSARTKRVITTPNYIYDLKVADNGIIFYLTYDNNGQSLWRTDTLGNNFSVATNVNSGFAISGNICVFAANSGYGYELWKSDGTKQGTNIIADINPGAGASYPSYFKNLGNKLLFQAYNGTNYYLFITDGSVSGTKQLSTTILPDLSAGGVEAGGKFYFSGYEPAYGTELYKTDGTTGGTKLVKDIYPGSSSSYPSNFAAVGNTVYCTALEDTHGRELWKTTGNASSTKLVKDIVPGVGGLSIQDITGAAGKLFFINNNELWTSDGSSGGTHAINDPGLANIQYMDYMIAAGNKLFIAGYDYNYGTELFEGDASASNFAANAVAKTLNTTGLTAKLINNPFVNDLNIEVNSPVKQQLTISVSNAAGLPVASKVMDVSQGTNLITLPAASWSHGIYFININSSAGNVGLKAMK